MKHLIVFFLLFSLCSRGQSYEKEISRKDTHYESQGQRFKFPDFLEDSKEYVFTNKIEMRKDSIYDIELKVTRSGAYLDYKLSMYYKGRFMEGWNETVIINVPWLALSQLYGETEGMIGSYMLADTTRRNKGVSSDINFFAEKNEQGKRLISLYYAKSNENTDLYLAFYW